MKKEMLQELLFWLGAITIGVLSIYGLVGLDNYEKEKANTRCGGAENVVVKTERNGSTIAKTLPDVIIGGKRFEKKQFCAIVSYKYKGKNYETGNCK